MPVHLSQPALPGPVRGTFGENTGADCLDTAEAASRQCGRLDHPHELLIREAPHRVREIISALAEQAVE